MYLNKALIFGNLTRDPEVRALPSGMNVCSFGVATNRVFRDREGKKQEKKYRTEIVADRVQFGPRSTGSGQARPRNEDGQASPQQEEEMGGGGAGAGIEYPKDDINPDDIPF